VRLDVEENGQIGGSDVDSDAKNAGKAASTAQSGRGFSKAPPPAIFFPISGFIWGIPVNTVSV
jgi:hypothetical protein